MRIFGKFSGLYLQFRIPKGYLNQIIELMNILQPKNIIEDFYQIPRNPIEVSVRIKSSLKFWDSNQRKWIFDWKQWKKSRKFMSDSVVERLK